MDLIFEGVDELEVMLDEIADEEESSTDPSDTIRKIRKVIENGNAGETGGSHGEGVPPDGEDDNGTGARTDTRTDTRTDRSIDLSPLSYLSDDIGEGANVFHARLELEGVQMKGVDAMLVLGSIEDECRLLETQPEREEIEEGDFDDGFEVFVSTGSGAEKVEAFLEGISKVGSVEVTDITDEIEGDENEGEDDDDGSVGGAKRSSSVSVDEIQSIRVDVDQIDDLYNQIEELVTSRIRLRKMVHDAGLKRAEDELDELDKISSRLQDTVLEIRLVPLKKVVGKFPRLVRDLARSQEKEIEFEMEGTEIELDRSILNEISDPLMHLLRNAVDHGIEPPEERERKGKPREGKVRLTGERERDRVRITIEDDGRGLDVDSIREKAIETDIMSPDEAD
ncbi:MAG: ATP-binding protein, partial [Halobacteria archaeon]|nr:ATP-binding protein [Halobacteria archaeon]